MSTPLTTDELTIKLRVAKHRLESALDRFYITNIKDQVALEAAALDIATTIRVLIHDTPASTALLKQLDTDYLSKLIAFDPLLPPPPQDISVVRPDLPPGTQVMSVMIPLNLSLSSAGTKYTRKDPTTAPSRVPLRDWWTSPVWDSGNNKVSNEEITKGIANKDGGAHVDGTGSGYPAYRAAKQQGQISFGSWPNKLSNTARLGHFAAIAGTELVAYITEHFGV